MGYVVQVGAFSNVNNAARLTGLLRKQGLDAYYFVFDSGLYKVRFGNFETESAAKKKAESLKSSSVIETYYIVSPQEYTISLQAALGADYVREAVSKTAESFLGIPYLWGGTTSQDGFDCSGLTMAVYRINGLNLPRSSLQQFEYGISVEKNQLQKGDLVFFKVAEKDKISHVGIFSGEGTFIHAPGRGKVIRRESLAGYYFDKSYAGARRYIE